MPRFESRYGPTESISWTFDRPPEIGEAIVLGYSGVFRGIGIDDPVNSTVEAESAVVRIRDATREDVFEQFARGVNQLPPRG